MLKIILEHLKEIVVFSIFAGILLAFLFVKKFCKAVSDLDWDEVEKTFKK